MRVGVWAITGTPTWLPYPCRCGEPVWSPGRNCGSKFCPCWGRLDATTPLPATCCARRYLGPIRPLTTVAGLA